MTASTPTSLQGLLDSGMNIAEYLQNLKNSAYFVPVVPSEFANWRTEQKAWVEGAVLFDQSHHMDTVILHGSDALTLISDTAANGMSDFHVNRAKQYIHTNKNGYMVGDGGILFRESENEFHFIGRAQSGNWLRYHAETGGYGDVEATVDRRSPINPMGRAIQRRFWRFQIQGPNAWPLIEKLHGGTLDKLRFFHMARMNIAGEQVRTLRHGMSGVPGLEIWGDYASYERIRDAIIAAGEEFGLVAAGARAYHSSTLESGFIPDPLPAIYTGEELRAYREWLPSNSAESIGAIAGSFASSDIEDYYLTPWELGYGQFMKFDHEFIGRDALVKMDRAAQRRKVTFEWDKEDFSRLCASMLTDPEGEGAKYFDLPSANYGYFNYDKVVGQDGRQIGLSMWSGYTTNVRSALSIGTVDPSVQDGSEVTIVWGEPNGGTRKTTVERHKQFEVRAIVCPAPYSATARTSYRQN